MTAVDPEQIRAKFLDKFRQIASERVEKISDLFATVRDKPGEKGAADELMRELHTLKGESRMMGFGGAGQMLHSVEDVLKEYQAVEWQKMGDFFDQFNESMDSISAALIEGAEIDAAKICSGLAACVEQFEKAAADSDPETEPAQLGSKTKAGAKTPKTLKTKKTKKTAARPKKTAKKNEAVVEAPPAPEVEAARTGEAAATAGAASDREAAGPNDEQAQSSPLRDGAGLKLSSMVRVQASKLDQLSDMAGELFSAHLRLHEMTRSLESLESTIRELSQGLGLLSDSRAIEDESLSVLAASASATQREVARFRRELNERSSGLASMLDYILEHVREIRLLPVSNLFNLYRSATRDIARQTGKRIEVKLEGESTPVDRSILDALGDIMLHLIRNAADHGIESPEERTEKGKNPRGLLTLRARSVNDRILVDVMDDGQGISPTRVRETAVRKGLLTRGRADELSDEDCLDLIFLPGFSTSVQATDFSGRGVGMDVVRTKLQDLGGSVQLSSLPGQGTKVTLELPTSIAIARVLLFQVADQAFALLGTFVQRVDRVSSDVLIRTPSGLAISVDGTTIPVADASELLKLGQSKRNADKLALVFVEHGGRVLALSVDRLIGERELTIKPFSPFLTDIRAVSGVATLEDGGLVLVLHAGEIAAAGSRYKRTLLPGADEGIKRKHRVLLVEDSLITRELERSVLVSFGLEVDEAGNGLEGLEKVRSGQYDLIVSDVEMPGMNGFEMTRRIKDDEKLGHLPIILVTTLGGDEHRRQGLAAGADGYVVKSEFGSQSFLDLVRRFLV